MTEIGQDISKARLLLTKGQLVAIPTETVYGLAANAYNPDAIAAVYKAKNRPEFDPLIVHIPSVERIGDLVTEFPDQAQLLAEKFWPGPLTMLLKRSQLIHDLVTAGMDRVAIRIPGHTKALELLNTLDFPLVAPSANPFGYISPTKASHVNDQLGNKIPYILDGGECEVGIESTIIGWENDKVVIYRLGGISKEQIEEIIGHVNVADHSTSNPKAPGMLKSHYAPRKGIVVGKLNQLIQQYHGKKLGIISFKETIMANAQVVQVVLAPDGKLETAAKNLFSALRKLDNEAVDFILAEEVPAYGIGMAINDRLRRAAAPKEEDNFS